MATTQEWDMFYTSRLTLHLSCLGFCNQLGKEHYLGVVLDTLRAILSEPRQMDLLQMVDSLCSGWWEQIRTRFGRDVVDTTTPTIYVGSP